MRSRLVTNQLLDVLPPAELRRFLDRCSTVGLQIADVLHSPGKRIATVYFPTCGFISLVMPAGDGFRVEVGLVGNEGMFGIPVALGGAASQASAVVRGTGSAIALSARAFRQQLDSSDALRAAVQRYASVCLDQLAQAAACMRFHVIEARLARWLLMIADRSEGQTFRVTHSVLAAMLGVRLAGVTFAAGALQDRGIICGHRGSITVLERERLKAAACSCYDADLASYRRLLGSTSSPRRAGARVARRYRVDAA